MMKIRAYTMPVNLNHAPHVGKHNGRALLTLANCKPGIRAVAKDSDWIAAITPARMGNHLAYLMRVNGSWTREEYWHRFKTSRADSIYKPTKHGEFTQLKNSFHGSDLAEMDLSCNRILKSNEFYFFAKCYSYGDTAPLGLPLPKKIRDQVRLPMRRFGRFIEVSDGFIEWVKNQPGRLRSPESFLADCVGSRDNCRPAEAGRN